MAGESRVPAYAPSAGHHGTQARGASLRIEKVSYKSWQRCFGRSVGLRAPGRFVDAVKCVVARTRTAQLHEIPTYHTKLSQFCHACGTCTRKKLSQRFHCCPHCGLGHQTLIQRDLYSAWLASVLDPIRLTFPSRGQLGIRLPKHGGVLAGRPGRHPATCERAGTPAPLQYPWRKTRVGPQSWLISTRAGDRSPILGSVLTAARTSRVSTEGVPVYQLVLRLTWLNNEVKCDSELAIPEQFHLSLRRLQILHREIPA
jgi:hypothetical protein